LQRESDCSHIWVLDCECTTIPLRTNRSRRHEDSPGEEANHWSHGKSSSVYRLMTDCRGADHRVYIYITSTKINIVPEAGATGLDASNVIFHSSVLQLSGNHSQRRLRPDVTSELTHGLLPPQIPSSSPPRIAPRNITLPICNLSSILTAPFCSAFTYASNSFTARHMYL